MENEREVQSADGAGVTLYRKQIDCGELDPKGPETSNPTTPGQSTGGGNGSGGGSGAQNYPPRNCNPDPNYVDLHIVNPDGSTSIPKCEDEPKRVEDEPIPEPIPDIIVEIKDECLKAMVEAAIDKGIKFTTEQTLNSIFNIGSKVNLHFSQASYSDDLTDGGTLPPKVTFKSDG